MNQIILIGRLTADPECRYFESGSNVTNFRIVVDRIKPREGQPQTDYFSCEAWGKLGDSVGMTGCFPSLAAIYLLPPQ